MTITPIKAVLADKPVIVNKETRSFSDTVTITVVTQGIEIGWATVKKVYKHYKKFHDRQYWLLEPIAVSGNNIFTEKCLLSIETEPLDAEDHPLYIFDIEALADEYTTQVAFNPYAVVL